MGAGGHPDGVAAVRARVLSTVFPHVGRPTFGVFVRERARHLAACCDVRVVAPLPWFPAQRWVPGRDAARPPAVEEHVHLSVYHPRILSVPGVAKSLDGVFYGLRLLPYLRRLRRSCSSSQSATTVAAAASWICCGG